PVAASVSPDGTQVSPVDFRMYSNYSSFIERAEIRIFDRGSSLQAAPLGIVPIDAAGAAEWQPPAESLSGPVRELKFVLRAYDAKGRFDETEAHPLWLIRETPESTSSSGGAASEGGAE